MKRPKLCPDSACIAAQMASSTRNAQGLHRFSIAPMATLHAVPRRTPCHVRKHGARARPMLGIVLRIGAVIVIGVMFLLVKMAGNRGVHIGESLFWRQLAGLPVAIGWLWWHSELPSIRTARPGAHALRMMLGIGAMGAELFLHDIAADGRCDNVWLCDANICDDSRSVVARRADRKISLGSGAAWALSASSLRCGRDRVLLTQAARRSHWQALC